MKLLLDQNLSHRLLEDLAADFPGSTHVRDVDLKALLDQTLWDFAKQNGFAILSKDSDFHQMSFLFGAPPKVVWIRLGNCTTDSIADLLRSRTEEIRSFLAGDEAAFLILGRG